MAVPNFKPERKSQGNNPLNELQTRSLWDYLYIIRERWILALTVGLVVGLTVAYFRVKAPEIFQTTTTLSLEIRPERIIDDQPVVDTSMRSGPSAVVLQTYMQTMRSATFTNYVVESLTEDDRNRIQAPYRPEDPDEPPPSVHNIIRTNLRVGNLPDTFILAITMRHRDPAMAEFLANRIAQRFIQYNLERTVLGNDAALAFLQEQSQDLRRRVENAENALQEYRQRHQLVSLDESQNIVLQRLKTVSGRVQAARGDRINLASINQQINEVLENGDDILEISQVASFGSLPELKSRLDNLTAERASLEEKYLERHPRMIQNTTALRSTRELIDQNVSSAIATLRANLRTAQALEDELVTELRDAEKEILELDAIAIQYNVLRRTMENERRFFDQILVRQNQVLLSAQLESIPMRIVDEAGLPSTPVEPDIQKIVLQAVILGGIIFVMLPIGLEFLDNKLKNSFDVENFIGVQLLGLLPDVARIEEKERLHIVRKKDDDGPTESFRGLYSQLQLTSKVEFPKAFLITSTIPGEGKSFAASNLGESFAAHNHRTLLVDCDFRRPTLHKAHEMDNENGVLSWLESREDVPDDIYEGSSLDIHKVANNLYTLRSGGRTKSTTEWIDTPRFRELFVRLKKEFDVIIVDSPPVGIFPDALSLSSVAEETIYICRYGKVNRQEVKNYCKKLSTTTSTLLGLVINAMPAGKSSSYYYRDYGYYSRYAYQRYYQDRDDDSPGSKKSKKSKKAGAEDKGPKSPV